MVANHGRLAQSLSPPSAGSRKPGCEIGRGHGLRSANTSLRVGRRRSRTEHLVSTRQMNHSTYRNFQERVVIAHIRHVHTNYDKVLMSGTERLDARALVREKIDQLKATWRAP